MKIEPILTDDLPPPWNMRVSPDRFRRSLMVGSTAKIEARVDGQEMTFWLTVTQVPKPSEYVGVVIADNFPPIAAGTEVAFTWRHVITCDPFAASP